MAKTARYAQHGIAHIRFLFQPCWHLGIQQQQKCKQLSLTWSIHIHVWSLSVASESTVVISALRERKKGLGKQHEGAQRKAFGIQHKAVMETQRWNRHGRKPGRRRKHSGRGNVKKDSAKCFPCKTKSFPHVIKKKSWRRSCALSAKRNVQDLNNKTTHVWDGNGLRAQAILRKS